MGLIEAIKKSKFFKMLKKLFGRGQLKLGIYGPPNAGKTTLANKILRDFTGDIIGAVSEVPHETRKAKLKTNVKIKAENGKISIDVIDTPGITTKIDYHNFVEQYGFTIEDARRRAKEATQGVIESIKWLEEIDGILLVLDSAEDPMTQVNLTILGNLEARNLPVLIVANKIDLKNANPNAIKTAFSNHPVVPISALTGYNIDNLYKTMVGYFR